MMKRSTRGLALALLLAATAQAQDSEDEELEALLALLDEETEIATQTRLNADYVPGVVTVLRGEDVAALGARHVLDALALARALDQAPLDDALPLFWRMRRGHLTVYQAASRFLTPQYQSDSAAIAWFRDRIVAPVGRVPPFPRLLGAIASGIAVPPLAGEPHIKGQPVPPDWAMDGRRDG